MRNALKSRKVQIIGVIVMIPVLIVAGFGFYLANTAGVLPWQSDPTRIPVVAFEGLETGQKIATRAPGASSTKQASPVAGSASPVANSTGTSASPVAVDVSGTPNATPSVSTPAVTATP